MALDNGKGARRPHSQQEYDAEKKALEDKIVNDSGMEQKIYENAVHERDRSGERGHDAREHDQVDSNRSRERSTDRSMQEAGPGSSSRSEAAEPDEGTDQARRQASVMRDASARRTRHAETSGQNQDRDASHLEERPHQAVKTMNSAEQSEDEIAFEKRMQRNKKKSHRVRLAAMIIVEALTLACIFGYSFVHRYLSMTQDVSFDVNKVKNDNIDISKKQTMEGYWTVAVFGVDSRNGSVGKGTNADVQLIVNVDMGTGDIKMVSVYRDTYLNLGAGTRFAKINEAYADGGPEQAVAALNKNLDLDIENYMTFNWKAVADGINMLGGVDVNITHAEFYYMNAYIHETCIKTGISDKNPAAEYISKEGYQHLDGIQAVAYARLRYMDSDFERTKRQREIITQCLAKAKNADLATLTRIIDTVLPQVAFNIDTSDIIELAKGVARYNIKDTQGFPQKLSTQMMGKKGDCVIPQTLASNVTDLHAFLFGDENYDPSDAVKKYSQKIADDSGTYKNGGGDSDKSDSSSGKSSTKQETISNREQEDYDLETETDASGKVTTKKTKKSTSSYETDADGNIILYYDDNGKPVYETNASGNKVKETTKSAKTTDADGDVIEGTDKNGDKIKETTSKSNANGNEAIEETDADGNIVSKGEKETTKADKTTKETKASESAGATISESPTGGKSSNSTKPSDKSDVVEAPNDATGKSDVIEGGPTGNSSPGSGSGSANTAPGGSGDVVEASDVGAGPG
ncbi:MAG: LCP family protein [Oribacterium sp.]|nr:LCP family protein [Oribacterium sp.]